MGRCVFRADRRHGFGRDVIAWMMNTHFVCVIGDPCGEVVGQGLGCGEDQPLDDAHLARRRHYAVARKVGRQARDDHRGVGRGSLCGSCGGRSVRSGVGGGGRGGGAAVAAVRTALALPLLRPLLAVALLLASLGIPTLLISAAPEALLLLAVAMSPLPIPLPLPLPLLLLAAVSLSSALREELRVLGVLADVSLDLVLHDGVLLAALLLALVVALLLLLGNHRVLLLVAGGAVRARERGLHEQVAALELLSIELALGGGRVRGDCELDKADACVLAVLADHERVLDRTHRAEELGEGVARDARGDLADEQLGRGRCRGTLLRCGDLRVGGPGRSGRNLSRGAHG